MENKLKIGSKSNESGIRKTGRDIVAPLFRHWKVTTWTFGIVFALALGGGVGVGRQLLRGDDAGAGGAGPFRSCYHGRAKRRSSEQQRRYDGSSNIGSCLADGQGHAAHRSCILRFAVRVAGPPRIYFCRPIRHNAAL